MENSTNRRDSNRKTGWVNKQPGTSCREGIKMLVDTHGKPELLVINLSSKFIIRPILRPPAHRPPHN